MWSLISETLEDSLHGGKQRAVILLQICKRAEEEKDLFNAQQFYERELELYEASITSLQAATRYNQGASALLQKSKQNSEIFNCFCCF